jgi:hypothetical protein
MDSYHRLKLSNVKLEFNDIKDMENNIESPVLEVDLNRTPSFD